MSATSLTTCGTSTSRGTSPSRAHRRFLPARTGGSPLDLPPRQGRTVCVATRPAEPMDRALSRGGGIRRRDRFGGTITAARSPGSECPSTIGSRRRPRSPSWIRPLPEDPRTLRSGFVTDVTFVHVLARNRGSVEPTTASRVNTARKGLARKQEEHRGPVRRSLARCPHRNSFSSSSVTAPRSA